MKQHLSRLFPKIFKRSNDYADTGTVSQISLCESQNIRISASRLELTDCRTARIFLLDKSEIEITIKNSMKAFQLIQNVCLHQNIFDSQYFGLKYKDGIYWKWLEESRSLRSQLPGLGLLTFYFGVNYYPTDPSLLVEEASKLQIFNQLKSDLIARRIHSTSILLRLQLYALILQSEFGDFDNHKHKSGYFCDFLQENLKYEKEIVTLHRKLRGRSPSEVENEFLDRIKWQEFYGLTFMPATYGSESSRCMLGIGPEGIVIYKAKIKIHTHYWTSISKISLSGDLIKLRAKERPGSSTNTYIYSGMGITESEIMFKELMANYNFRTLSIRNPLVSSLKEQQHLTLKNVARKSGSKSCTEEVRIRPVSNFIADSMKELDLSDNYNHHHDNQTLEHKKNGGGGYSSEPDRFKHSSHILETDNDISVKRHKHTCRKHISSSNQDVNTDNIDIESRRARHQQRHRRHQCNSVKFPPQELVEHFRYIDPIDEGLNMDEIKNIPYTVVQTSNKDLRRLDRSPSKRNRNSRSTLDWRVPDGEAPPPYLSPIKRENESNEERDGEREEEDSTLLESTGVLSAIPVNTLHVHIAPIVKTKSLKMQSQKQPVIVKRLNDSSTCTTNNQYFSTVILGSKHSNATLKSENFEVKSVENNILRINKFNPNNLTDCANNDITYNDCNIYNNNSDNMNLFNEENKVKRNKAGGNSMKDKPHKNYRNIKSDCEVYEDSHALKKMRADSAHTDQESSDIDYKKYGFKFNSDLNVKFFDSRLNVSNEDVSRNSFIERKGNSPPILLSTEKQKSRDSIHSIAIEKPRKTSHWLITQI